MMHMMYLTYLSWSPRIAHDITYITFMAPDHTTYSRAVRSWLWNEAANAQLLFGSTIGSGLEPLVAQDSEREEFLALVAPTPGWREFMTVYEYAYNGIEDNGPLLQADFYDQFFGSHRDLPRLLSLPEPILDVLYLAQARQVLDGGPREVTVSREELDIPSGQLAVAEVAVLADIDTRSVRNAMNAKLPDPLVGQPFGKRVFIPVEEARRWLAGRKGFRPTTKSAATAPVPVSITLTGVLANQLLHAADLAGLSVEAFLERTLSSKESSS